jgi:hypothetical protein
MTDQQTVASTPKEPDNPPMSTQEGGLALPAGARAVSLLATICPWALQKR